MFRPGRCIILREVHEGRVWAERPVRVVADDDIIALWLPRGTHWRKPFTPDGGVIRIPTGAWELGEAIWHRFDVLQLIPSAGSAPHAAWAAWNEDGDWAGWYINLQEPLRRVADGFEYLDLALDLLLLPDGTHRWKDEDELEEYVQRGVLTRARATRVRAEAEMVLAEWLSGGGIFGEGWDRWRPDEVWPVPSFGEVEC